MNERRSSSNEGAVRSAYRQLIRPADPARRWLEEGAVDGRFASGQAPARAVVRGSGDLVELHDIIDELFGVGCFERPRTGTSEVVQGRLVISRPTAVMPLIEALRPWLEGRGPVFWTWKTAREAVAARLTDLDGLTVEAGR
ncbi:MAG: hypothetical protein L7U56_10130 [Acidimicrobiales bacterium]|nr:hypothetical protein [Acidimicrobiales bacterium]